MKNHRTVSWCIAYIPPEVNADIYFLATRLQDIRLELAKEDTELAKGGTVAAHSTSLTEFLMKGLELEEQQ
jgi:hypothetical protein